MKTIFQTTVTEPIKAGDVIVVTEHEGAYSLDVREFKVRILAMSGEPVAANPPAQQAPSVIINDCAHGQYQPVAVPVKPKLQRFTDTNGLLQESVMYQMGAAKHRMTSFQVAALIYGPQATRRDAYRVLYAMRKLANAGQLRKASKEYWELAK
jgi:hypothetical protein